MLIHKATLGVLDYYWTGRYAKGPDGQQLPLMAEYTLEGTGLGADEWWYVPSRSPLASRIRWSYPWMDPVIGEEGELLDIHPWPRWKREGETPPEEQLKPQKSRQHRRRGGMFVALLGDGKIQHQGQSGHHQKGE